MTAEILPFHPPIYPDARDLIAPDGRRWCARTYLPPEGLRLLTSGRTYDPCELVRLYGLYTRDGEPGLFLYPGEELPASVEYRIEPITSGED